MGVLCEGCSPEFGSYLTYCRNLRFDETPDYAYLRRLFKDLFFQEGYIYDLSFDWVSRNSQSQYNENVPDRRGGDSACLESTLCSLYHENLSPCHFFANYRHPGPRSLACTSRAILPFSSQE